MNTFMYALAARATHAGDERKKEVIMNARNRGIGIGFVSGIAVAIACKSTATSTVDAHAADSIAGDVASTDAPLQETTVPDRLRVRTADSDVDQLEEGSKGVPGRNLPILVVAGPIVITDVWPTGSTTGLGFSLGTAEDCSGLVTRGQVALRHLGTPIHNVRVAVKAGEFLCISNVSDSFANFEWSGYRPYAAN
jgi:hypothetical protein